MLLPKTHIYLHKYICTLMLLIMVLYNVHNMQRHSSNYMNIFVFIVNTQKYAQCTYLHALVKFMCIIYEQHVHLFDKFLYIYLNIRHPCPFYPAVVVDIFPMSLCQSCPPQLHPRQSYRTSRAPLNVPSAVRHL